MLAFRQSPWIAAVLCGALAASPAPAGEAPASPSRARASKDGPPPQDAPAPRRVAQDLRRSRGPYYDGYLPYLYLAVAEYVPPPKRGKPQIVRLQFSMAKDIPRATVITFTLEYGGLDHASMDYKFDSQDRKGIVVDWKPDKTLVAGEYFLRSRIWPDKQPPSVRRFLESSPERFPADVAPWPFLYMTDELRILVPTTPLTAAQERAIQTRYTALMKEFFANLDAFSAKMEAVRAGKDLVDAAGKLDSKRFREYVIAWRKKQGATQEKVAVIEAEDRVLFLTTRTAFLNLRRLGSMISKRARTLQDDVSKQYGEKPIDPFAYQWYDRNYLFHVGPEDLERQRGRLLELIGLPRPPRKAPGADGM